MYGAVAPSCEGEEWDREAGKSHRKVTASSVSIPRMWMNSARVNPLSATAHEERNVRLAFFCDSSIPARGLTNITLGSSDEAARLPRWRGKSQHW